ncbi:hypothetical protein FPV67DRAFT_1768075 [Lyophyllum atratum]|nr:hypothetical protein FPV67DRAFT_1768075 [Lyophyllum atratum]
MAKRRREKLDSDSYMPQPRGQPSLPATITQRHTHYELTDDRLVTAHSYIKVPGLPTKPSQPDQVSPGDYPSSVGNNGQDTSSFSFDWMDPSYLPDQPVQPAEEPSKRRRTLATDNPLMLWEQHIDEYLRELLRLEGRGDAQLRCAMCHNDHSLVIEGQPLYRCSDCVDSRLFCAKCIVTDHCTRPLHRVKAWNGHFFTRAPLMTLGLRVQLGHPAGDRCINPVAAADDGFVVIHSTGIHTIALDFCDCLNRPPRNFQLLRARFYPATTIFPKTAATFDVLETFQLLSFMSKASAFEFYQTLVRRTDNTGTTKAPDRYSSFLRMVREWRHLKLLKRAGRGNDPLGVKATREGECAVMCPACPLPGINLPDTWREAPDHERWLYALFLGIDANFRLKRLKVSSAEHDPGLNHGYAYFVDDPKFKAYLQHYGPLIPDDISTCSNHDAIKSASIRGGKGVDASGVGKAECARHDMKRPVSVGDLQKGERYVNMDFFFLSSLTQNAPQRVVVSYDIACQWGRNLKSRCKIYPPNPYGDIKFIHLVPKFHLRAHRPECHVNYSFNLTPHVGRTDGEAPERGWAAVNAVATSTKEMGPGSRRDTLDDHFGDYNWRKVIILATTLLRKMTEATTKRAEQVTAFELFDSALPVEETSEWTRMVQAWEEDGKKANPYAPTLQKITETAVRLELAAEEEASLREELTSEIHDDVPPSRLIAQGIEIEDHQRILLSDSKALGPHATDLQRSKIIERRTRLWRKIEAWISIQQLYIPGLAGVRARAEREGGDEPVTAVNIDLLLPSKLTIPCDTKFLEYEWRLRYAQAHSTLHEIRRAILLRSQMYKSKDTIVRGQRMHTRSLALIATVQSRIKAGAQKYSDVRDALVSLAAKLSKVGWETDLKVLTDPDLRGLTAAENDVGDGRHTMSWIWMTTDGINSMQGEGKQEALRIEWCRARARAHRWQEECLLLEEEMRRVLAFFGYEERRWLERSEVSYLGIETQTVDGMRSYCHRQAAVRRSLITTCRESWKGVSVLLQGYGAPEGTKYRVECH